MLIYIIPDLKVIGTTCLHKVDFIQNVVTCNIENSKILLAVFFYFFSFAKMFYIIFYPSYVSICKDLQKTIVLPSGPFLQLFTFTIHICNLWWSKSSPSEVTLLYFTKRLYFVDANSLESEYLFTEKKNSSCA